MHACIEGRACTGLCPTRPANALLVCSARRQPPAPPPAACRLPAPAEVGTVSPIIIAGVTPGGVYNCTVVASSDIDTSLSPTILYKVGAMVWSTETAPVKRPGANRSPPAQRRALREQQLETGEKQPTQPPQQRPQQGEQRPTVQQQDAQDPPNLRPWPVEPVRRLPGAMAAANATAVSTSPPVQGTQAT